MLWRTLSASEQSETASICSDKGDESKFVISTAGAVPLSSFFFPFDLRARFLRFDDFDEWEDEVCSSEAGVFNSEEPSDISFASYGPQNPPVAV